MDFREISTDQIKDNAFDMIGKKWMLVTASNGENVNSMTASWGGIGIMWGKPVAFVFIRPQRYTKEFIDKSLTMSLSFYDESHRKTLNYMGTVSGRDEDKIKKAGLTTVFDGETPYFKEAEQVLIVKKLYAQEMDEKFLVEKTIHDKWYPENDYHTMYVCEIEKVLVKNNI